MSARVVVVVVNWNGAEFLPAYLRSALDQEVEGGIEVVVVDNGSSGGSVELVQRDFPEVRLLHNEPNNYAAANNRGVEAGSGDFDPRWGEHRNLPRILDERESWIAMLLEEVARLRLWRLPWRRLKPDEKAFLEKVRKRRQEDRT